MKLKPCPFCGGSATDLNEVTEPKFRVKNDPIIACLSPDCPQVSTRLMFWNSRPGEQAARAEVLELVKLTMNAIIKTHNDTKLRTGQMGNKAAEIEFALNIICENYQLKFGKLIEAEG